MSYTYLCDGRQHLHPADFDVRLERFPAGDGIARTETGHVRAADDQVAYREKHYRALRIPKTGRVDQERQNL